MRGEKMKRVLVFSLVLVMVLSFTGILGLACKGEGESQEIITDEVADDGDEGQEATGDEIVEAEEGGTIYYLLPELLGAVQVMFEAENKRIGEEIGYEIITLNANNQVSEQLRQLDDAIAQKPKAIILNAVDSSTVTGAIEKARADGIKVLVLDRFITETEIDFTSALGTVKMGEIGAEESIRLLKEKYGEEKGVILEVMGDSGDNYSVTIHQGFESVISEYPNIEIVSKDTPGWDTNNTINIVNDQLTARDDIDIIFIHWDGRVPWIYPVLEEKGYAKGDIKIVGTDGVPEALDMIREGWLESTVNTPIISEVNGIWEFMVEVLSGEEIAVGDYDILGVECELVDEEWGPTLYVPGAITNMDNVDDEQWWGNAETPES
jgi:ribose transport system substrate-binding protein